MFWPIHYTILSITHPEVPDSIAFPAANATFALYTFSGGIQNRRPSLSQYALFDNLLEGPSGKRGSGCVL